MLRSSVILLLLVGAAIAEQPSAYQDGKQYTYKIKSRTLASFNQQSKHFTGIEIEGYLTLQSNGQNNLRAKISQPRYSQIHTRLEDGWESRIPPNQVNLQSLPLSDKPFEIKMKNGVVHDIVVDKEVPTWEVNILKSIVSQLQVDTKGENLIESSQNQLPESSPYGMYRTMEDTVSGKCEVLYDVSVMPERVLQNRPELAPMPELKEDGNIISLVKTKNYSNCEQRVSYHSGFSGHSKWEPGSNDNERHLSRSTVSRIVISGNLKQYTIQSSVTTNKVMHIGGQQENQQGLVASKMNLTLHEVKETSDRIPAPSNPESTGNLVYQYNNPYESSSERRAYSPNSYEKNNKNNKNSKYNKNNNVRKNDQRNKYNEQNGNEDYDESDESYEDNRENNHLQPKPKLSEPPKIPMLPFFVGNGGNSIKKDNKVDVVKAAKSIAQQIGNEMQRPDSMMEQNTLEKFTILYKLVRTMNAEQIAEVQRDLYEQPQSSNQISESQNAKRNAWVAYRDAVARAGTGPALLNVKQWVKDQRIKGSEARHVISAVAKSAITPTTEYLDAFFEMASAPETKENSDIRESSILAFADLIHHAVTDRRSAHNRYPVHAFEKLVSKNTHTRVHEKYIPYMAEQLRKAVDEGDSKRIQLYTTAIGKTGDSKMLSVFEPYLEGKKQISPHQRLAMVLSLDKLAESRPKVAQSVLYKIYSNNADYHEIRTAAVFMLMETNPPASMLQRMAEYTNYDSSKHVNSAVKSTIESLAQLDGPENRELANAAKTAQPLLTSETYGPQYSRAMYREYKKSTGETDHFVQANYIGSDDTIVPKGFYLSTSFFNGVEMQNDEFGAAISSLQDLVNFVKQQCKENSNNKEQRDKNKKYSPENVAQLLGIRGDDPQQIEGYAFFNGKYKNLFAAFDNHTLEKIPQQLIQLAKEMKSGQKFHYSTFESYEVTVSFPTETGFPFEFSVATPVMVNVEGDVRLSTDNSENNQNHMPNAAAVSGKVRIGYATKVQKRLGFVTPFEHQEYLTGIDRNLHLHLPIRAEVGYNQNKREVSVKVQPNEDEKDFKLVQYKTQPFTAKHDILNLEPISQDKNSQTVHKDRATTNQIDFPDDNNKPAVQFIWERQERQSEEEGQSRNDKRQNAKEAGKSMARSIMSVHRHSNYDAEYQSYTVKVIPPQGMTAEVRVSFDASESEQNQQQSNDNENSSELNAKAPHLQKNMNENERKQKLLQEASKNIKHARAYAMDVTAQFKGAGEAEARFTGAFAYSHVDEKSRALMYSYGQVNNQNDYHVSAAAESKEPRTESIDYEETLKANKPRQYHGELHYGKGDAGDENNKNQRIHFDGQLKQTEDRKNQIRQSRDAQECSKDVNQNGNKLSYACQTANHRASLVNQGEFTVYMGKDSGAREVVRRAEHYVNALASQTEDSESNYGDKEEENRVKVTFEISPNDEKLDLEIKTPGGKYEFNNLKLVQTNNENNGNVKDNRNKSPLQNVLRGPSCNLDKSEVKTFDERRYSVRLGKCWHVAMTSYPKADPDRPSQQQEIPENKRVSILAKDNENGQKELKITLGKYEIQLSPSSEGSRRIEARVDGQRINFPESNYQQKDNDREAFHLIKLHDGSAKLVSEEYNLELVYDGTRAQIHTGDRYRDSVRGLCGNNDGEPENDQQTPKGCYLQKPEEFAATYALTSDGQCEGPARENVEKAKRAPCSEESHRPGNVISDREAGREERGSSNSDESDKNCSRLRTKVVRTDSQICFSLRPLLSCSSSCNATGYKDKNIQFHCVDRTSVSESVAERVEKGVNPDLSQKKPSKSETLRVPINCKA